MLIGSASSGPLELVKLFYDDGRYDTTSILGSAFECAAGAGQTEILKFFLSNEKFGADRLDDAILMAATFGKVDVIRSLYAIDELKSLRSSVDRALNNASSGGYVEATTFLCDEE